MSHFLAEKIFGVGIHAFVHARDFYKYKHEIQVCQPPTSRQLSPPRRSDGEDLTTLNTRRLQDYSQTQVHSFSI